MKINTLYLLEYMREIRDEVINTNNLDAFYNRKLKQAWEKAKETDAYKNAPDYDKNTFLSFHITTKEELKSAPLSYLRVGVKDALKYYQTTGTTGTPTPTPRTDKDMIANTVSVAEAWRETLTDHKHRVLILLPSDIVPVADLLVGVCEYLNIPHTKAYPYTVGISDWDKIIGLWHVFNPTVLVIAPGVLLELTQTIKRRGLLKDLSSSVMKIMMLGEVSTPEFRKMVGTWWNASALDASYGSTESGTLAACCEHDKLHLLLGANYFEIEKDGNIFPLKDGINGRLVVTPLNNDARPLLRLNMGDEVTIEYGCQCGRNTPYVTVHGRGNDKISLKNTLVSTRDVERIIYSNLDVAGYLLEVSEDGSYARVLLERDAESDKLTEPEKILNIQNKTINSLGFTWDEVHFVNRLPVTTKSGGSQKSWKKSNIHIITPKG
ncbi:TPA: hypothetical protein ACHB2C_004346 [Klebsiella variicola subsp. variicola]